MKDAENNVPVDYKVFCFGGEPKYIVVDTDRFTDHRKKVYDLNWKLMKGYRLGFSNGKAIKRPEQLNKILKEAQKLSREFPHTRVDFYINNQKVYFGEITFTNGAGFDKISPRYFDEELGSYIKLPIKQVYNIE